MNFQIQKPKQPQETWGEGEMGGEGKGGGSTTEAVYLLCHMVAKSYHHG